MPTDFPSVPDPRTIKKNYSINISVNNLTDEELFAIMETFQMDTETFKGEIVWLANELPFHVVLESDESEVEDATN